MRHAATHPGDRPLPSLFCLGKQARQRRPKRPRNALEVVQRDVDLAPLDRADIAHSVGQVARALSVNRKTLVNHCQAEGFAPPGSVVAWCLILLTTALLATPGITVERIAMQLNFPSGTALRNLLKRHTGLRPIDLRTPTALAEMCGRFLRIDETRPARA